MAKPATTRQEAEETIQLLASHGGNICAAAEAANISRSTLQSRVMRARQIMDLPSPRMVVEYPGRLQMDIESGTVIIGSDFHYWPGEASTAHRAFVKFCRELKPRLVVANGDVFDGASISRHNPLGWEDRPTVQQEIEVCQERLGEIETAAGKCRRVWTLGNHDARFEARLASVAPEYAGVSGFSLKDRFALWEPGWSIWINDDVAVKHRLRNGVHARWNNTIFSGKTLVTGHLHNLGVTPFSDYRATRWGVDTGTMADIWGPQFEYLEDSPRTWRSGFAILTFHKGKLLWPEVVHVLADGQVEFRGIIHKV